VIVRVLAGARITVPEDALTATFPKFMLPEFVIVIGVMIVPVAVAVAETWAKEVVANPRTTDAIAKNLIMFFIDLSFLKLLLAGFKSF
jgi:phosphate starvation-inducible membrane PsiE